MKNLLLIVGGVLCSFVFAQSCFADSVAPPRAYVITSTGGQYFFKMVPMLYTSSPKVFGVAYKIEDDGSFTETWKVDGWYARGTELSRNGEYLVRKGPWHGGSKPRKDDLAVAFYKNGKLLKEYFVPDLIADRPTVQVSSSHYRWLAGEWGDKDPEAKQYLDYKNMYHLKTLGGIVYEFDATTSEIKSKRQSYISELGTMTTLPQKE